tara:strand:- start:117 stop:665 length:549 start_codon:yes stop_codon:yes gene_type:complete
MVYEIRDNLISKGYQDFLEETFIEDFPWYYQDQSQNEWEEEWDSSNFIHMIHSEEQDWQPPLQKTQRYKDMVYPILLQALDRPIRELYRIRAVMNIRGQISDKGYPPHIDLHFPHLTMLYYVNDADGPTRLYDGKQHESPGKVVAEVEPKKGRVLFMDGNILHAGTSTTSSRRMIINFNFIV